MENVGAAHLLAALRVDVGSQSPADWHRVERGLAGAEGKQVGVLAQAER